MAANLLSPSRQAAQDSFCATSAKQQLTSRKQRRPVPARRCTLSAGVETKVNRLCVGDSFLGVAQFSSKSITQSTFSGIGTSSPTPLDLCVAAQDSVIAHPLLNQLSFSLDKNQQEATLAAWVANLHANNFSDDHTETISCIRYLADFHLHPPPEWLAAAETSLMPEIELFTPLESADLTMSLAKLHHRPSPRFLHGLHNSTLNHIQSNLYPSAHLVGVLESFAQFSIIPGSPPLPPTWTSSFLVASLTHIHAMDPTHLPRILLSLARINAHPDSEWMAVFEDQALTHLHTYSGKQLANLLYAFATLSRTPSKTLQDWVIITLPYKQQALTPAQSAEVLFAITKLNLSMSPQWQNSLLSSVRPKVPRFTPQALSDSCWALPRLPHPPPASFVDALVAQLQAIKPAMSAPQAANCLHAFASFDRHLSPEKLSSCLSATRCQLANLDLQMVLNLADDLAHYNCQPCSSWSSEFAAVTQPHLASLTTGELAGIIRNLAQFRFRPSAGWTRSFLAASGKAMKWMEPEEVAMCVSSVSELGCGVGSGWMALCMCAAYMKVKEFDLDDLGRLRQGLGGLTVEDVDGEVWGGAEDAGPLAVPKDVLRQYQDCLFAAIDASLKDVGGEEGEEVMVCVRGVQGRPVHDRVSVAAGMLALLGCMNWDVSIVEAVLC